MGADALVVPLRPPRATWGDLPEDRIAMSKVGIVVRSRQRATRHLFRLLTISCSLAATLNVYLLGIIATRCLQRGKTTKENRCAF
jgi:hypothetical protein